MNELVVDGRDHMIETALIAAVQAAGEHTHAVGIWVVSMRARQAMACQFVARLDIDPVTFVPAESTGVVLVAVAPCRVSDPVITRVDVVHDFLCVHGLDVRAVYMPALVPGGMWSSLRGSAMDGIVPLGATKPVPLRRPRRLQFLGWGPHRWTVAAMVPLAALVFALPVVHAAPTGQPGIAPHRPGTGQAGVTAPPRVAAGPQTSAERPDTDSVMVSERISAVPPIGSGTRAWSGALGSAQAGIEPGPPETVEDTLRFGAVVVARPDVVPLAVTVRECVWNAFLSGQASAAVTQAGLPTADAEALLGTSDAESAVVPQELVWAQTVAADPQAMGSLTDEVAEPVAEIDPQAADLVGTILAQLPSDGR
ncbi:hypothetical protein ABZ942_13395 [Nocardia sp. NPDC046473]|uniref:hypothetical protein n=1 Tax=Nocardia sp. NPDC046473 TaxID=3155733 RepID=UPI0033CDAC6D